MKPQLNPRDEYRDREMTLKYYSKQKFDFKNSKIFLVHVNSNFCQPQLEKKTTDRNESKNSFSGIEKNTSLIFKNSGIKIDLILF